MSIIVMTDDDFEKNMKRLADQFHPLLAVSFRARDTAQREAIEAWKAAHAREATALAQAWEQCDAAQVKLAQVQAEMPDLHANMTKALDLLQVLTSTKYTDRAFVEAVDEADEMLEQLRGKVVLKGLADQQEAQPATFYDAIKNPSRIAPTLQLEAQGAQAGDKLERLSVTNILLDVVPGPDGMGHEVYAKSVEQVERRLCDLGDRVEELTDELAKARAALATQPEAGQFAAAAAFVRNIATDYANEHGWDDMGGLSFGAGPQGTAKMEHFLFLEELAEKLRTMTTEGGAGHA